MAGHVCLIRAICPCGWSYGPALQTDIDAMIKYHRSEHTRSELPAPKLSGWAKCDCGWSNHPIEASLAKVVKAVKEHRKDMKEARHWDKAG